MDEHDWLAERFEEHRTHLRAVAYRMLGSLSEADDAVQEAWLRLSRADADEVENLGGWLTTVVARVSLNMLRSRDARREEPLERARARPDRRPRRRHRPRARGAARRLGRPRAARRARDAAPRPSGWRSCCTTCSPCPSTRSRRSSTARPTAARQLASRARRRVQGERRVPDADLDAPARGRRRVPRRRPRGRLRRAGRGARPRRRAARRRRPGARCSREVRGAAAVAGQALGYARSALVVAAGARQRRGRRRRRRRDGRAVLGRRRSRSADGRIVEIDILADPERLAGLDLTVLDG